MLVLPDTAPKLNRGSPLARGLDFLVIPNRRQGVRNLVNSYNSDLNTPVFSTGQRGLGGYGSDFTNARSPEYGSAGLSSYSVHILFWTDSLVDFVQILGRSTYVSETNNQGWQFQTVPNPGSSWIRFNQFNNASSYQNVDATAAIVTKHVYSYTWTHGVPNDGTGKQRIYRDGVKVYEAGQLGIAASTGNLTVGSSNGPMYVLLAATWKRELSGAEARLLHAQPWSLLAYPTADRDAAILSRVRNNGLVPASYGLRVAGGLTGGARG